MSTRNLTIRDYGNGLAEVGWSYASKKRKKVKRGESEDLEGNRKRAIRHARTVIRRKVMNAGLDYLLTLTYKENMCDF